MERPNRILFVRNISVCHLLAPERSFIYGGELIPSLKLNQIDSNLISNNMVKFNLGLI
jgi:hypothetical protein